MKVEWKIAVAYLRRSTKKQEASIGQQRKAIEKYARDKKYKIIAWYIDDGISGDNTERRFDFLRMRDDAAGGKFQHILCWDQDRFGRFDSLDAGYWIYPFRQAGVSLVTTNDGPIDWDDFSGRTLYALKQEAKHQFLRDHSRDVVRGQVAAAKSGSWIGGIPYGYIITGTKKQKRLEIGDATRVSIVKRIFREYVVEQRSLTDIADRLNGDSISAPKGGKWRYDGVKSILENITYTGMYRFNHVSRAKYSHYSRTEDEVVQKSRQGVNDESEWILIPNNHPALIDKQTYDKANARLAKGHTGKSPYTIENSPYLLANGLLRCGHCGSVLWSSKRRGRVAYDCSNHQRNGDAACPGTVVTQSEVLNYIENFICETILGDEDYDRIMAKAKSGSLKPSDLPKGFHAVKQFITGADKPKTRKQDFAKLLKQLDLKITAARANLLELKDKRNIPIAEAAISTMLDERERLLVDQRSQPSDVDINAMAIDVLSSLIWFASLDRKFIRSSLCQIDHVEVLTKKRGSGQRTRYDFVGGKIHFRSPVASLASGAGGPKRVPTKTGKLNLRLLVQSQAAYH